MYAISNHTHKFIGVHEARKSGVDSLYGRCNSGAIIYQYDPPLPTSILHENSQISKPMKAGVDTPNSDCKGGTVVMHGTNYDPPLPTSILQFKSEKGKHKTQKPTTMMIWILKYYSKEGYVV